MAAYIPRHVREVLRTLRKGGFAAYLAGGCVRDLLMKRKPHDWDVATSAPPERTALLFPRTVPTGIRHGTVTVIRGKGRVEVTTFRREGKYSDGRRPAEVLFLDSLIEDLGRRDFTVNAMAMDEDGEVTDPYGGREDMRRGILRCVGNPEERFGEDALRMLRAIRFSAQLGFMTEPETERAIARCAHLAAKLSAERVRDEMDRILRSPRPEMAESVVTYGLFDRHLEGRPDNPMKELSRLRRLPGRGPLRWSAFCAVLMRYGAVSDPRAFLRGLRLEAGQVRACSRGIELVRKTPPLDALWWKGLLAREEKGSVLCAAAAAEVLEGRGYRKHLAGILKSGECCRMDALEIDGNALIDLGYTDGVRIGSELRRLLRHVLEHPLDNRRELLLEMARRDLGETGS